MTLTHFTPIAAQTGNTILLASAAVPAGEPAELCDELEAIDLNEYITGGRDGVYLIRAVGDSMEAEIKNGDILIVNRNLQPSSGDVVVASVNNNFTVKIYQTSHSILRLVAKNSKYLPQTVTRKDDFEIFGVVTDVLHKLKKI